jgi:outer membrane lipoprotein-sorting protein
VGLLGGAFRASKGLLDKFGAQRVIDTPLSETAIIGCALGAAISGLRPVAEIMFMDFTSVCMDQIVNQVPKIRYMLGGQVKGDMASGTIYFKHPHFLRLEQEKPRPETLIANKDTLWWIIPEKRCAYQYPADDFGKELRLLSDIFRGLSHVEDSFQVVLQQQEEASGRYEIQLIPDPPWEEIDRITVSADQAYTIHAIQIHNTLGTVTRFTLGPLSEKEDFEEGFFRFEAAEGMEVIVEGAAQ